MSVDTTHSLIAAGSLAAIGYGLWAIYAPLCPLVLGSLLLTGIIFARTRPVARASMKNGDSAQTGGRSDD